MKKDYYGLNELIIKSYHMEDKIKARNEQWCREANALFGGRWVRDTDTGAFYKLESVEKCQHPFLKFDAAEKKEKMVYLVKYTDYIDPRTESVVRYEIPDIRWLSLMNGSWITATNREVADAAMKLSSDINDAISRKLDKVNSLMCIYRAVTHMK